MPCRFSSQPSNLGRGRPGDGRRLGAAGLPVYNQHERLLKGLTIRFPEGVEHEIVESV